MVAYVFKSQYLWGSGNTVSFRPTWSTKWLLEQPDIFWIDSKNLTQKYQNKNKNKKIISDNVGLITKALHGRKLRVFSETKTLTSTRPDSRLTLALAKSVPRKEHRILFPLSFHQDRWESIVWVWLSDWESSMPTPGKSGRYVSSYSPKEPIPLLRNVLTRTKVHSYPISQQLPVPRVVAVDSSFFIYNKTDYFWFTFQEDNCDN